MLTVLTAEIASGSSNTTRTYTQTQHRLLIRQGLSRVTWKSKPTALVSVRRLHAKAAIHDAMNVLLAQGVADVHPKGMPA